MKGDPQTDRLFSLYRIMGQIVMEFKEFTELTFYCDEGRHMVCLPYSTENLHRMADILGVKRAWFHRKPVDHYDMPKQRIQELTQRCILVSKRKIYEIAKGIIK